jgi:hypothetical protein
MMVSNEEKEAVAAGGQKYLELVSGSLHSRKGDFRDRRVDLCIHDGDLARELDRYHCIDYEPMDVFVSLFASMRTLVYTPYSHHKYNCSSARFWTGVRQGVVADLKTNMGKPHAICDKSRVT